MTLKPKIYLAGPMTGIEYFNFPMFDTFRDIYKNMGYIVFSPADHDRELLEQPEWWMPQESDSLGPWKEWNIVGAPTLRKMLGDDLGWIAKNATHMAMLPGWEKSNGAFAEWALAKALSLDIKYYPIENEMIKQIRK